MDPSILGLLDGPVALIEADGVHVRWCNGVFARWTGRTDDRIALPDALPAFGSDRARRSVAERRPHAIDAQAPDDGGRARQVEYRLRPIELAGEPLWLLEGFDRTKVQVKQALLEAHARTIDAHNRRLVRQQQELDERNGRMAQVLDTVGQALFVVDLHGAIAAERSKRCDEWFGAPGEARLPAYLARLDPSVEAAAELGLEAVRDDVLPLELNLEQMPCRLTDGGRHLSIEYRPIRDAEGALQALLVVVTDVTAEVERARQQAHEHDFVALARSLMRERESFGHSVAEIERLFHAASHSHDAATVMRSLHTLKSTVAQLGASRFATEVHAAEDRLREEGTLGEALRQLRSGWNDRVRPLLDLSRGADDSRIEISTAEHERLLAALEMRAANEELAEMVRDWRLEHVEVPLKRLATHAQSIASRLGKGPLAVEIAYEEIRLPPDALAPLWASLIHAVRNSVDHGTETAAERTQRGKARSVLRLEARADAGDLLVRIGDDGRGIDWSAVAQRSGRAVEDRAGLIEALFSDGFSTRDVTSELSGRGFGLAAVRHACLDLGGSVRIESDGRSGTTLEVRVPLERRRAIALRGLALATG